ncbi:MAG: lipid II-degrading bacteriocin, partial [Candidatus Saccharimonadales bacterium]
PVAFDHYLFGNGKPIYTGVDQLHLDQVPLGSFPHLGPLLDQAGAGGLAEGSYKVSDKMGWAPPGLNNEATFGHIRVKATGVLTVRSDGYTFKGQLHAEPDRYDFNWSWGFHDGRSALGEASTVEGWSMGVLAHMYWGGGNSYQINFVGAVPVKETYP